MSTLYEQAKSKVENSEILNQYAEVILADWNEGDEHWKWVISADESEIVIWAKTVQVEETED